MLDLIDALSYKHTFFVAIPSAEGALIEELNKRKIVFCVCKMRRWLNSNRNGAVVERCKWYGYGWLLTYYRLQSLKKFVKENKIDLIHTNTSVLSIGCALQKATKLPHVFYVREFGQEDFNLQYACFEKSFYRAIDRYTSKVIAVSKAVQSKYLPHLTKVEAVAIYDGVGEAHLNIAREYGEKETYSFLIAGSLHPTKGQDIAIKAANILVNRGFLNFKLYIAGSGKQEWFEEIEGRNIAQIAYLGQVYDMPALRKTMDMALVCSKSEAFGRVTVEAMMSGMPVIGSNAGGTAELIQDDFNGYLYEREDAQALANKMQYLLEHPKEIERLGKNAQEYAREAFSIERCAQEVEKIYESCVK